jgi:hypothetical protein
MAASEPKKPFHARMAEKLAASRFFTFSAMIHLVIIFLVGSVVLFKHYAEPPDFVASEGGLVANEGQVEAPPEQPPDLTEQTFQPTAPQITAPTLSAINTTNLSTPTFQVAQAVPIIKAPVVDVINKAPANAMAGKPRGVTGDLPATMRARVGGARGRAMMINGGKWESEKAVLLGLRWLARNQNKDGSWGGSYKAAMTGFAFLSFLGHGETPVSPEFGPTVGKALDWLVKGGARFEGRLSMEMAFNQPGVYEHAIATYALGEYYTMTKDERVVDLLTRAVGYIVDGQSPDGGWVYGYKKDGDGDTSVSGWQIQALKAAHLTGLDIPGVDQALDRSMLNLKRVQGPHGGFGYHEPEDRYGLTGVGVLCTYFWKQQKDKSVMDGIDYIMSETDKDYPIQYQGDKANLYAWYYDTQACLMVGGAAWMKWNRLFQTEIVKAQSPDGGWPPMRGKSPGDLQTDSTGSGPFYRTNLCILMLEVYYRYMPSTK